MTRIYPHLLIAAFSILSSASFSVAAEMRESRNLPYTEVKNDRRKLDVYWSSPDGERPVIVWIHGGGWQIGDKRGVQHKPQAFVDRGYVFVSINYRFVPDVTVDEMAGDVAKAIKWVHDHAAEYGGSAENIIVSGHSAGAHLAALVCTDERYLEQSELKLSNIKACIPVDTAVYDAAKQIKDRGPRRSQVYTTVFTEDEQQQRKLSPLTHVAADKEIPPFLILHVASRPDSTAQSQAFAEKLKQSHVEAQVVAAKDKDHGSINRELGLPEDQPTREVFQFLDRIFERQESDAASRQSE